jgi:hypothetical protein
MKYSLRSLLIGITLLAEGKIRFKRAKTHCQVDDD